MAPYIFFSTIYFFFFLKHVFQCKKDMYFYIKDKNLSHILYYILFIYLYFRVSFFCRKKKMKNTLNTIKKSIVLQKNY